MFQSRIATTTVPSIIVSIRRKNKIKTMTTLVVLLTLVMVLSCAPASQSASGTETSQAPNVNLQNGGPVEPSATPLPVTSQPPPSVDPTPTPKTDRADPRDPVSQPTPENDDSNPAPAFTPEPPRPGALEPTGGIAFCADLNPFSSSRADLEYMNWCHEALMQDVSDNCAGYGDGSSEAEHRCGVNRLVDVKSYFLREVGIPCLGISDERARIQCYQDTTAKADAHLRTLWGTWAAILSVVESDDTVKKRKAAMADCVVDKGYASPGTDATLEWQEHKAPDQRKADRIPTETTQEAELARLTAIDECAFSTELYVVQEEIWLSEIQRRFNEDPAQVRPLLDNGIKEALEADGIAPFLTLRN